MKTKHTALKSSSIGASTAVLLAASAQINAAGVSLPIWAGQFKQAYSSTSNHTSSSMIVRSGTSPSLKDHLIWAAQFKEPYAPSSPKTHVATGPGPYSVAEHLLWSREFQGSLPAGPRRGG
jgi:hypothetical protein